MPDRSVADPFLRLVEIMARLRGPGGCPWDREQTPESLRPYVIEEAYEVLEAIECGDPDALRDELGDLRLPRHRLLVAVHASRGAVVALLALVAWLGGGIAPVLLLAAVEGVLASLHRPSNASLLPALARAQQLGEKARQLGLDWPDAAGVLAKLREEQAELEAAVASDDRAAAARELGDVLLTLTSLARHLDVPAEMALRDAAARFVVRARRADAAARARGAALVDLGPDERDRLWTVAKQEDDAGSV